MKTKNNKFKTFALIQVTILVIALFAFAWMVGSSFGEVSAVDPNTITTNTGADTSPGSACTYCVGDDLYSGVETTSGGCGLGVKVNTCSNGCSNGACVEKTESNINGILGGAAGSYLLNKGKGILTNAVKKESTKTITETAGDVASSAGELETTVGQNIILFLKGQGTVAGSELAGQVVAGGIWVGVAFVLGRYIIGPWIGLDTQNSQALGYALGAGAGAAYVATVFVGLESALAATGIGIVVAAAVFIVLAKRSSTDVVTYNCYLWDAELGGKNCEECNNQDVPCTEYQCKSLGQACEYSKDSETGQIICEWENPNDIKYPEISAWDDALLTEDYEYTPNNAISPPNKGVKIEYNGADSESGCAPAWTPVSFGITLNERAKCKYSLGTIYDSFEDMPANYFSNGLRLYNHSFALSLPTTAALAAENITVENGGVYEFYTMCQDANGNANSAFFGIKFCVDDGPDNNVPIIEEVYPPTDSPFGAGQSEQEVTVYVNEPAECKWDKIDKSYSDMNNNFSCVTSASGVNPRGFYECTTVIDGLKDNVENKFYFRCKDQPWLEDTEEESMRNENSQSYKYSLIGTSELVISSISPNDETIYDSVSPVSVSIDVRTDFGYDDGKAICSIRDNNDNSNSFIEFFYGYNSDRYNRYEHSQALYLEEGDYNYTIKCCDIANNCDQEESNFNIKIDSESPEVIRIFKIDNNLQIITNEKANCVYSTESCAYGFIDGIKMQTSSGDLGTEHFTSWDTNKNLYIKCEDRYGKRPTSDDCTITIRPIDIPELK